MFGVAAVPLYCRYVWRKGAKTLQRLQYGKLNFSNFLSLKRFPQEGAKICLSNIYIYKSRSHTSIKVFTWLVICCSITNGCQVILAWNPLSTVDCKELALLSNPPIYVQREISSNTRAKLVKRNSMLLNVQSCKSPLWKSSFKNYKPSKSCQILWSWKANNSNKTTRQIVNSSAFLRFCTPACARSKLHENLITPFSNIEANIHDGCC